MPMLDALLDRARLSALVDDGLISRRPHPSLPLTIYNYTERASARRLWTAETRLCRGLVVGERGEIVSRPFPKFFSIDELEADPGLAPEARPLLDRLGADDAAIEVTEKLDGSLGISYLTDDGLAFATRGSFDSPPARWATAHWRASYASAAAARGVIRPGVTYLVEIVYPGNRVVIDYGATADVVLLTVIDNDTGADVGIPAAWPGPVVAHHAHAATPALRELLGGRAGSDPGPRAAERGVEREGLVLRLPIPGGPSPRVKVKFAGYERAHRLVTQISSVSVWEHLAAGRPPDELTAGAPAPVAEWIDATAAALLEAYRSIESACRRALAEAPSGVITGDRRAVAAYIEDCGQPPAVLFKMVDRREYADIIWRAVRPPLIQPWREARDG